ncbi:50S ribosomal protein L13 [Coxiella endosymbiont of Amblyomma americanum]|nr:50S ribosomal protein L13 [Coxiella endosymbiont of Amblyomma americanum]AJC50200.1 50S ribosomal protein L13 [Coxiella endosymbiont of Amblyomma americanum]
MGKQVSVNQKWLLVDAEGKTLGRLASWIAVRLLGKHKPEYVQHTNIGDFIVVINAGKIRVTGKKLEEKQYHRHSGYPGGIKTVNFSNLQKNHPGRVLELAVKRMLPKGSLGRNAYRKLKIYSGMHHPHQAQNPSLVIIK